MNRDAAPFWLKRELPRNVAYLIKDHAFAPWHEVTYKEIFAKKTAKQLSQLRRKRIEGTITRRACYIHVFNNPQEWFFFTGWWIYVVTLNHKQGIALNFKQEGRYNGIIYRIMNLFHADVLPFDYEFWADAFERKYHVAGRRERQAKVFAWCYFDALGDIIDIQAKALRN